MRSQTTIITPCMQDPAGIRGLGDRSRAGQGLRPLQCCECGSGAAPGAPGAAAPARAPGSHHPRERRGRSTAAGFSGTTIAEKTFGVRGIFLRSVFGNYRLSLPGEKFGDRRAEPLRCPAVPAIARLMEAGKVFHVGTAAPPPRSPSAPRCPPRLPPPGPAPPPPAALPAGRPGARAEPALTSRWCSRCTKFRSPSW